MTVRAPHVVSFRLTDEEATRFAAWRAATDENTAVAVGRLLLNDPHIIARMEQLLWQQ